MSVVSKFRKTIEITVDGEKIPVTVRKLGIGDLLDVTKHVPGLYQKLVDKPADSQELLLQRSEEGLEVMRHLLLKGVVDPPLCAEPRPDCLTISDLEDTAATDGDGRMKPIMDILNAIAEISNLEGLFRRPGEQPSAKAKTKKPARPRK